MLCAVPIEIAARELDGMLCLALHLAAHGLPTLLGERMVNQYVLSSGKPVIYFDSDQNLSINEAVLAAGGRVLNLNPEGLNQWDRQEIVDNLLRIVPCVTRICSWGEHQATILRSRMSQDKIGLVAVTGYPSFDLANRDFLPYYRNDSLAQKHGEDYILMNTSFTCNHVMGFENYIAMLGRMKEWRIYKDEAFLNHKRRAAEYQQRMFEAFVDLARRIAARFPERHVVIRPHPAENMDFYRNRTHDLPNVFVDRAGSVRHWIATARAVIHHDCTTGLEALLMGKPVIQFRPFFDTELAAPIVSSLGVPVTSADQALDMLAGLEPGALADPPGKELEPYFVNLRQSAAQSIAALAAELSAQSPGTWLPSTLGPWESLKCWRKHLSKALRAHQPGHNGRKVRYSLEKFPRIQVAGIRHRLDRLRAVKPDLPPVRVECLALNTFLVQPATG